MYLTMPLFQTEFLCSLLDLNPGSESFGTEHFSKVCRLFKSLPRFAVCLGKQ